jgi:phosphomannomutase
LQAREAHDLASGARRPIALPASDVLAFDLADGSRVLVRPSGTEPKVKVYYEVREPIADAEPVAAAAARAEARIAALRADLAPHLRA